MDKFSIKQATINDINSLYEIELNTFKEPWKYVFFYACFLYPKIKIYKGTIGKKIIAFMIFQDEGNQAIHLLNLAVLPEYQGSGIGSQMLDFLISSIKDQDFRKIFLEVRFSNTAAINLYKKFGFIIEKKMPGYYHEKEDGYLMTYEYPDE